MLRPVFSSASDPMVSVDKVIAKEEIEVYPNPANSILNINFIGETNAEGLNVDLRNIYGQLIMSENLRGSTQIDVSNLADGLYFVHVYNQGEKGVIKKIVISK